VFGNRERGTGIGAALLLDRAAHGDALTGNAAPLLSIMVVVMSLVGLAAALGPHDADFRSSRRRR
jgi:hypothetical protein